VVRGRYQSVGRRARRRRRELRGPLRHVQAVVRGRRRSAAAHDQRDRRRGWLGGARPEGAVPQVVRRYCRVLGEVRGARRGDGQHDAALLRDARPDARQPDEREKLSEGPARVRRAVVQRHQRPFLRLCTGRHRAGGVPRASQPLAAELRELLQGLLSALRGVPQEPPGPGPLGHNAGRRPRRDARGQSRSLGGSL
jgi:hypothetical protein